MLILCGSSMSCMEDHVLAYKRQCTADARRRLSCILLTLKNPASALYEEPEDLVYKRNDPHLPSYMEKMFEEICKQYQWKQLLSSLFPYKNQYFFRFSKAGFTKGCYGQSEGAEDVLFVTYGEIAKRL